MYNYAFIHPFVIVILLLISLLVQAQEPETFAPEEYEIELRTILEKVKEPAAYQGKIALEFANHHNTIVKQFPESLQQIDQISKTIAQEYNMSFEQEGTMITTAQFTQSNQTRTQSQPAGNADMMQSKTPEEIFKVVEQMPRFPGCEELEGHNDQKYQCAQQKLLEFVYENLQYPSEARIAGVEGRVVVQFVVEEDGEITDVLAVRDIGYGCGAEVERIVISMNSMDEKWTPGKQRGKPVRVVFTLPVSFKL
ncbi:MAG TPA: energy transducer TonB [Saprospiraceae bacterium]|nr:energy transducer TonB [Saprospiraceae bacterium]